MVSRGQAEPYALGVRDGPDVVCSNDMVIVLTVLTHRHVQGVTRLDVSGQPQGAARRRAAPDGRPSKWRHGRLFSLRFSPPPSLLYGRRPAQRAQCSVSRSR